MFVNKIGQHHLELGENCQDAGKVEYFPDEPIYKSHKLVCDGCSEGKHSEVGAQLYALNQNSVGELHSAMENIIKITSCDPLSFHLPWSSITTNPSLIRDYCCFTILDLWELSTVEEENNIFILYYCGDGYIITEDIDGNIDFIKIDDGEYPKYLAYNYISDKSRMSHYKDGVDVSTRVFPKKEFKNVGVASDGIRYILNHDENLRDEFIQILKDNKEIKMKRFINKHQNIFKDDITIAF